MRKNLQHDRLEGLDRELPDREDLTVRKDVEMRHDNLPKVIDAANIHEGRLYEPAHSKRVNLLQDFTFGRLAGILLLLGRRCDATAGEHGRVEVFKDAHSELGQSTDKLCQALHVEE